MKVTLRYFAALREAVGVGQEALELPADVGTVGAVRELLRARRCLGRGAGAGEGVAHGLQSGHVLS